MSDGVALVVLALATWRLTHLVVSEGGPFAIFEHLRRLAGAEEPGELVGLALLFSCVWCFSVWAAALLYIIWRWVPYGEVPLWILAASGGSLVASLYERQRQ